LGVGHVLFDIALLEARSFCRASLSRRRSLTGCKAFDRGLVREHLRAAFSMHRRFRSSHGPRIRAMTIHQAENREFEGVIVLWPFTAMGAAEQKRRLLYSAITRAKRWCTIVLQSRELLSQPPFTA